MLLQKILVGKVSFFCAHARKIPSLIFPHLNLPLFTFTFISFNIACYYDINKMVIIATPNINILYHKKNLFFRLKNSHATKTTKCKSFFLTARRDYDLAWTAGEKIVCECKL